MIKSKNKNQTSDKETINKTADNIENMTAGEVDNNERDNSTEDESNSCDNTSEMADGTSEWKDKYMRLSAEFDNYRKRTLKEKMDLVTYGSEDIIKALLPVMDDIDRAIDNMCKTDDIESVRTGIELITQKLYDLIKQKDVYEIEAVGCELDTDLHEAVAKVPVPDETQKGKIIDVVQKGYKLKDKVVRHAKVVVGE